MPKTRAGTFSVLMCLKHGSEALLVHDRRAGLVILALGDPHLLEGAQRCQDGAADPDRVPSLGWGYDLDLHGRRCKGGQLLRHALTDASEHRRTTGEHHVCVEVLAD